MQASSRLPEGRVFVNQKMHIDVHPWGVIGHGNISAIVNTSGLRRGRAVGSSFSKGSRRRLREFMAKNSIIDGRAYGLTLTLPRENNLVASGTALEDGFQDCLHDFGVYFRRSLPASGIIWRCELQTRGVPHLHCILWLGPSDCRSLMDGLPIHVRCVDSILRFEVACLWHRAVCHRLWLGPVDELSAWCDLQLCGGKGYDFTPITSMPGYMKYCADHMSKHKREQLGYTGRAWGVVGRGNFTELPPFRLEDGPQLARFSRAIAMLRRYRVRCDCVFGCRHTRRNVGVAKTQVSFASPETLLRLARWSGLSSIPDWPDLAAHTDGCTEAPLDAPCAGRVAAMSGSVLNGGF